MHISLQDTLIRNLRYLGLSHGRRIRPELYGKILSSRHYDSSSADLENAAFMYMSKHPCTISSWKCYQDVAFLSGLVLS
jgi:hypothetical protein